MSVDACCYHCENQKVHEPTGLTVAMITFIVCPECGNKRCPKATHHDNYCTGSNEPGQWGSRYQ